MSGIQFNNVTFTYANRETPTLKGLTFDVKPGELVLVTGASGCGKSTLVRVTNGLCPHLFSGDVEGLVRVGGLIPSTTTMSHLSYAVGTLFQDPEEQFFALNVEDEIAFTLQSRGEAVDAVEEKTEETLARLKIEDLKGLSLAGLSEGQKQKVGLAAILAAGPKVLVLDEPSANLDPEAVEGLGVLLTELKAQGFTILVVDHRLYWLKDLADRVHIMKAGEFHFTGTFEEAAAAAPSHPEWGLRDFFVEDVRGTLPRVMPENFTAEASDPLQVVNLTFAYPEAEPLFKDVNLSIPSGITVLLGENGCGKTTFSRILMGLEKSEGDVIMKGQVLDAKARAAHVGLVLQNADHQLSFSSVREELEYALLGSRLAQSRLTPKKGEKAKAFSMTLSTEDHDRISALLNHLHLHHLSERHPQSLSGGEKQRVVVAAALLKAPDLLILDEPTSGLDGKNRSAMEKVLLEEAQSGRAILLITHDLELLKVANQALDVSLFSTRTQPATH